MPQLILRYLITAVCLGGILPAFSQEGYNHYYGNLHAHSGYSDGCKDAAATGVKTPEKCYAYASGSEQFNFLGISEHNHSQAGMRYANYRKGVREAKRANQDGSFVCLYGMEYGVISGGGHVLIYGIDSLIGWEDNNYDIYCAKSQYNPLWKIIAKRPAAFAMLAHPEDDDYNGLLGKPYDKWADSALCGVAIGTGPAFAENDDYISKPSKRFYSYYQRLLARGYHVAPTIDHDNHYLTFGRMAAGRTVVLAPSLSAADITGSYKAMRFYASEDMNAKVEFTINGEVMGSRLEVTEELLDIQVKVTDDDGEGIRSIRVMYAIPGSGEIATQLTAERRELSLQYVDTIQRRESFYYYVEVVQADGDRIITAPIWVKRK